MCGIAGFISLADRTDVLSAHGLAMADAIAHRGPDDSGVWVDSDAGICLSHRRLAVIDLSPAGHQPIISSSGRYVMAFNGEIYNHENIRKDLERINGGGFWRGHSDTETLLRAIEQWGLEFALRCSVGMFAIALWDRHNRILHLARDRFGEKPLYYGWLSGTHTPAFVFGSELKAIRAHPSFRAEICRESLSQFLKYLYVPSPRTIYEGLFKLEPGCILTVRGADAHGRQDPVAARECGRSGIEIVEWWSSAEVMLAASKQPISDKQEALEQLEASLIEAVRLQSLADVPLGVFLSGGIDSSLISALMQQQSVRSISTFTIGFEEAGYDESSSARAIAQHLGTRHNELRVSAQMCRDVIAALPRIYDEPFADASQIPTFLVSRVARQHVTVALSGDGGDELFGGYNRYIWVPRLWDWLGRLPKSFREGLLTFALSIGPDRLNRCLQPLPFVNPGEKIHKSARALIHANNATDIYNILVSTGLRSKGLVINSDGLESQLGQFISVYRGRDDHQWSDCLWMMAQDTVSYLPNDILTKVDRAAMSVGLETRVPFLDHRVFELAWRLPMDMKIRGSTGKWALRQILYKYIPKYLLDRPKAGFAVPLGLWMKGALRDWVEASLDERLLREQGFFDVAQVRLCWAEHLSGKCDHTPLLWGILMFQAWLLEWGR